jgi:hypothetical protein
MSGVRLSISVPEASQLADHLARAHFLGFIADGGHAFFIPNAFVEDLPNQTAQPVGDCADRLGVSESGNEPEIRDGEDRTLGLHGGVEA